METFLSYTHRCINPPPCILICSVCCELHYPCSQHGFLCTTTITELLDVSAALPEHLLWIWGASSPKEEISMFLDFISSASLDPILSNSYTFSPHSCFFQSIFIIFLSLSLSLLNLSPSVFSCGALMHAKARFHSVSHPIIINLSTHAQANHPHGMAGEGGARH